MDKIFWDFWAESIQCAMGFAQMQEPIIVYSHLNKQAEYIW